MPLVTYSALRIALLAACFGLGYLAGLRTWLLLIVATLVAWGLSYVLLRGPRDRAALYLAERAERRASGHRFSAHAESDAAHEDAVVDGAAGGPTVGGAPEHGTPGRGSTSSSTTGPDDR
ncbi:DUF4229 domain-containing protein [Cellulomonas sp. ATA003]|uniref:DUF4229 domain-containing protein n=1 Tax=Cellulomonas sp. ATA003 TaxID=3073064 RepID=UPI002873A85B|nr:DUF4229 domain-containing protein [Cellulomonas sp. ATA003]WNB85934.1 DUF4229 domain-containing protein [Cellulomonas sp. ATA003]